MPNILKTQYHPVMWLSKSYLQGNYCLSRTYLRCSYDIDYQDLLTEDEKNVSFSHVAVGIQYGQITTLVCERDVNETQSKDKIEEDLSIALKAILNSANNNLNLNGG